VKSNTKYSQEKEGVPDLQEKTNTWSPTPREPCQMRRFQKETFSFCQGICSYPDNWLPSLQSHTRIPKQQGEAGAAQKGSANKRELE